MTLRYDIIKQLQEEVIFLQEAKITDKQLEKYTYTIKGDLSEIRSFEK